MSGAADFPAVRAAVAECKIAIAEAEAARRAGTGKLAARARERAAQERARAAYATELLPGVLGGEWRVTGAVGHWPAALMRRKGRLPVYAFAIFDHAVTFRRAGYRGPPSWSSYAVIGMPYNAFDKDGVYDVAAIPARQLAALGVGVWGRRDLSAWYPKWSQLVLAAAGLLALDPERFGFVKIEERPIPPPPWAGKTP